MSRTVRTRFAPSPTGGLHLGGVRTALFSYLYAKKHNGQFVLRIEDTDQNRFVEGAEEYITATLNWAGILPDESPALGGPYTPYRQSERKASYKQYALQLVEQGNAYYAFDTPEELEAMRNRLKSDTNPSPQYDAKTRMQMRNSLTLSKEETQALIDAGTPYVVRIKMPENETVSFKDMIRDYVHFDTNLLDDKVLLKADGMPTYHLAVVVDDYAMQITHAFRGEEWLPSAPAHILLWKYLGWENAMPKWAHLPLILKPDGNGKLSKRDGERLGFPVFAMDWTDPKTGDATSGFKERGFLPEAFINILVMLGWNSGTDQEIFTKEELIKLFDIEQVNKGGAKFDFEKAKWFNHEWIKQSPASYLAPLVKPYFDKASVNITDENYFAAVIDLVKERCTTLADFVEQGQFFFATPTTIDTASIQAKWDDNKKVFFQACIDSLQNINEFTTENIETTIKALATEKGLKPGDIQLPMRIMLVGGKFGPAVFTIGAMIGKAEMIKRIENGLSTLG